MICEVYKCPARFVRITSDVRYDAEVMVKMLPKNFAAKFSRVGSYRVVKVKASGIRLGLTRSDVFSSHPALWHSKSTLCCQSFLDSIGLKLKKNGITWFRLRVTRIRKAKGKK